MNNPPTDPTKPDPNQLVVLFSGALQVQADERAAYLDRVCAGDSDLRRQVAALLEAYEGAGDFLEQPAGDVSHGPAVGAKPGDRIGRYKLLQQIGEGGWGVVFMAEQEEPVRRKVALKIIKPGMDTKSLIARFEAERQALAMMDHPNIAKVFDAGATENGRPFFVMELVRGIKLTDYCDEHALSTASRLDLFIQVCHAVQHAHQKGIIHRDLKPSNILVTTTAEGKCRPKVIDFGIAKATTGERLTDKTLFTAFELLIGTPAYMSPEQAALTSEDVDTRTDIYSLGVLLYELLTSTTPFDTNALLKAGLDEVRRVIRNEEPLRPSARLGTMLAADLTTVAGSRQVNSPKLIRTVRGDLDWIVMKALEKDRTRRYETASGLALDVQHYLASEPISARPPSAFYKFRKTLLRNKLMSAGISIILLLLIAGLIGATWLLRREKDARRDADVAKVQAEADKSKAQLEAARSGQVTRFLEEMLEAVEPSVARGRDTTMLREILDRTAERVGVELKDQPAVEAELRNRIGSVYEKLGFYAQSETMLREALAIRRKHVGEDSLEAAESMSELSRALLMQEKSSEAVDLSRAALAARQKHLGNEDPQVAASLDLLGQALWLHHQLPEAEATMRQSLALRQKLLGDEHPDVATSINGLGNVLYEQKRYREAEPLYRQALQIWQKTLGNEHQSTCTAFQNLASVLYRLRDFGEAEVVARDLVAKRRKLVGDQHPNYSRSLSVLADTLMQQFKWNEAEEAYRELLPLEQKLVGIDKPDVYRIRENLMFVITIGRTFEEAEPLLNDLLPRELIAKPPAAPILLLRAEFFARRARWKDAAADASKALEHQKGDHQYYHALAPLLVIQGDVAGYRQLCGEIATRFAGTTDQFVADRMAKDCLILPNPDVDLQTIAKLADLAVTKGQGDAAFPMFQVCKSLAEYRVGHFESAIEWAQKALQSSSPIVKAEVLPVCAMAHHRLGQPADARAAFAKGVEITLGRFPGAKGGDLGVDWRDWIIAHSLMIEARNLIEGAPDSIIESTGK